MSSRGERGMVTVELALSIIALCLITMAALWFVWALGQQVRLVDTAGEVARQVARGDRAGVDRAVADRPAGSVVTSRREDGDAIIGVRLSARPFRGLPAIPLQAEARVALEPGVA